VNVEYDENHCGSPNLRILRIHVFVNVTEEGNAQVEVKADDASFD